MPVTPAHAAAAIVLARLLRGLPFLPLVVGTQVPDLPLFFGPLTPSYATTHSLLWGAPTNVGYGFLLVLGCAWMRPAILSSLPAAVRRRISDVAAPRWSLSAADVVRTAGALLLGAASHVIWDEFTHEGRWGVRRFPMLGEAWLGSIPGYKLLQYGSGLLGLLFVAAWAMRTYASRPLGPDLTQRWRESVRWTLLSAALVLIPLVSIARAYRAAVDASEAGHFWHTLAYEAVTWALAAELLLAIAARLLFALRALRSA